MSMRTIGTMIVAAAGLVAVAGLGAQASPMPQHQMTDQMKMSPDMAEKCKAMMAEHEKMAADMKAADKKLDELVTKMNNAPASAKLEATTAVVTELVKQRHAMDGGMMKMQQGMMSHTMESLPEGKESMVMCPMMKHKN